MAELSGQSIIYVGADSLEAEDALTIWSEDNNHWPNDEDRYKMTIDEFTSIADPKKIAYSDFVITSEKGKLLDTDDIEDAYYYDPEDPYDEKDPPVWEDEPFYYEDDDFEEFV